MAQIETTDDKRVNTETRTVGNRVADNTHAMADKGRDLARNVEETTVSMVEQLAEATPGVGKDLTRFWLDLVQGQLAHNVDAFRRFSTARDWRERLDVQGSYFSGNLARMSEAASRYAELAGKMMQGLLRTGSDEIRKAG